MLYLLCALLAFAPYPPQERIAFQNTILCKVHGTTLSMLDVKKKMDLFFYQHYPDLADSPQARFQFYEGSWRSTLSEMIDHELMLADAEEKEVALTDGEVREELENRFGPNVSATLDQIGLTYEEAWKMTKNDLLVRRMGWWFIHAKAMHKVTPQEIRSAYRSYLKENPPYQEWSYQIIRTDAPEETVTELSRALARATSTPEEMLEALQAIDPSVHISSEYRAKDCDLSEVYRTVLATLQPGNYSIPLKQKKTSRIFYLAAATQNPAPLFEEISPVLQNELMQKALAEESEHYFSKLRQHYSIDTPQLLSSLPSDFHPFSLE